MYKILAVSKKKSSFLLHYQSKLYAFIFLILNVNFVYVIWSIWIYTYRRTHKEHRNLEIRKYVTTSCSGPKGFDSKSPQVSRTLLSILAVLNNAVVWMVSTRPPTSKSSSPFSNPLVTVPNTPITIGIIVTCMFHSFFNYYYYSISCKFCNIIAEGFRFMHLGLVRLRTFRLST